MNDGDIRPAVNGAGDAGKMDKQGLTVLHVDDDPNDTALLQAASRKAQVDFRLLNMEDGEHAIAHLMRAEQGSEAMPSLVLLDMKMPGATGVEILRWIRGHATLNRLPVIVLSGSELQDDIRRAYAAGANSYLVKPLGFEALVEMISNLSSVWLPSARPSV